MYLADCSQYKNIQKSDNKEARSPEPCSWPWPLSPRVCAVRQDVFLCVERRLLRATYTVTAVAAPTEASRGGGYRCSTLIIPRVCTWTIEETLAHTHICTQTEAGLHVHYST